jgi:solute carrier family 36 (proton-coupled amino acid transporter)
MSSPSKPLSIASPRLGPQIDNDTEETASQTPDLRHLRQQFGTPPVWAAIPPFRSSGAATPLAVGSLARGSSSTDVRPLNIRPIGSPLAADMITGTNTPLEVSDLATLDEEEKIKVLRRHLVSRAQRLGQSQQSSRRPSIHEPNFNRAHSRQPSLPASPGPSRDNSEPFPLPYNAPGGDITYVHIPSDLPLSAIELHEAVITFTSIKNVLTEI